MADPMVNQWLIEDLKGLLLAHDWYFEYSDDHRVWQRGSDQRRTIKAMSEKLGLADIFDRAFDAVTRNELQSFLDEVFHMKQLED
tara:strand:- start:587 stop:841 length:255 start_codon:yes stop_codon:yes gene_type:complete